MLCTLQAPLWISIHALLAESDVFPLGSAYQGLYFYPRSPCGERPHSPVLALCLLLFLSTLSLRRATFRLGADHTEALISIHALLAESDATKELWGKTGGNFYPRSPCGERLWRPMPLSAIFRFLSTLSLRRATEIGPYLINGVRNFYPRSPCGERQP